MWRKVYVIWIAFGMLLYGYSCNNNALVSIQGHPLPSLSAYHFFDGLLSALTPNKNVFPYSLKNELFSDYLDKSRFVYLPDGQAMTFDPEKVFMFPEGTVLIKHFLDRSSANQSSRLVETRLLILSDGSWHAYPYLWDEQQEDAFYQPTGALVKLSSHDDEATSFEHVVPNKNQCKSCHNQHDVLQPIGPEAIHLNRMIDHNGVAVNQLVHFQNQSILVGYDSSQVLNYPYCFDQNADLTLRAKAYLDINCAHCHREGGSGGTSGLVLTAQQSLNRVYGVLKTPVATGKGSGGRPYTIVPGNANASILPFRMRSTDPGAMMPELGRSVVHSEGIALIEEWINQLDSADVSMAN